MAVMKVIILIIPMLYYVYRPQSMIELFSDVKAVIKSLIVVYEQRY